MLIKVSGINLHMFCNKYFPDVKMKENPLSLATKNV